MNIISSSSSFAISFFNERVMPSLTAQQKRILVIASIALGLVAAYYLVRYVMHAKVEEVSDKEVDEKAKNVAKKNIGAEATETEGEVDEADEVDDVEDKGEVSSADLELVDEEIPLEAFSSRRAISVEEAEAEAKAVEAKAAVEEKKVVAEEKKADAEEKKAVVEEKKAEAEEKKADAEEKKAVAEEKKAEQLKVPLNGQATRKTDAKTETGEFKDDKLIKGKVEYLNGDFEEGEFAADGALVSGKKQARGIVWEGKFQEGHMTEGKKIEKNKIDEGSFVKGELHGAGKRAYGNGEQWSGNFDHGVLVKGSIKYSNDNLVEGTFKDFQLVQGTIRWNGTTMEGTFNNGRLEGHGKITKKDGKIEEGEYNAGKLVEKK